jgi:hypothetical protein
MRVNLFLIVVALTACAPSGPTPVTSGAVPTPVRIDSRTTLATHSTPVAGVSLVWVPIAKVWQDLPAVYDSVGIPRTTIDPATHTLGNLGMQIRRQLGKVRLSKYLDCGSAQQGPSADSYDVHLKVTTQLHEEPSGHTRVTTVVDAMAKPFMLSGEYSRCASTGEIELKVHNLLAGL